jgi:ribosome-associated translation inhibitor RaiA
MRLPLQVTFRGMATSEALEGRIREEADRLEEVCSTIMGCRVVVEQPHHHQRRGNHFRVLVDLTVPGREIVAGRDTAEHASNEDPYAALDEAFSAARRQLKAYSDEVHRHR